MSVLSELVEAFRFSLIRHRCSLYCACPLLLSFFFLVGPIFAEEFFCRFCHRVCGGGETVSFDLMLCECLAFPVFLPHMPSPAGLRCVAPWVFPGPIFDSAFVHFLSPADDRRDFWLLQRRFFILLAFPFRIMIFPFLSSLAPMVFSNLNSSQQSLPTVISFATSFPVPHLAPNLCCCPGPARYYSNFIPVAVWLIFVPPRFPQALFRVLYACAFGPLIFFLSFLFYLIF